MIHGIVVLLIGAGLAALLALSAKMGGPFLRIVAMVLVLAGWTALVVALEQTAVDQFCELVIAVVLLGAVVWYTVM